MKARQELISPKGSGNFDRSSESCGEKLQRKPSPTGSGFRTLRSWTPGLSVFLIPALYKVPAAITSAANRYKPLVLIKALKRALVERRPAVHVSVTIQPLRLLVFQAAQPLGEALGALSMAEANTAIRRRQHERALRPTSRSRPEASRQAEPDSTLHIER